MNGTWLWVSALVVIACQACGGTVQQEQAPRRTGVKLTPAVKAAIAERRIFFGHQSVGANIVEGLADGGADGTGPSMRIVALGQEAGVSGGFFAHAPIGRNGQPSSKTDEFAALLERGLAGRVDIAFHKYCYLDLPDGTDVQAIFEHYRRTMARLHREFPAVAFVHVTAPLTAGEAAPKWLAKRLLGRKPDNDSRERFNELMRREYAGRESLFDLAAVESIDPEGRQHGRRGDDGRFVESLSPQYTSDGGHLNAIGRRQVADALLGALAGLVPAPR